MSLRDKIKSLSTVLNPVGSTTKNNNLELSNESKTIAYGNVNLGAALRQKFSRARGFQLESRELFGENLDESLNTLLIESDFNKVRIENIEATTAIGRTAIGLIPTPHTTSGYLLGTFVLQNFTRIGAKLLMIEVQTRQTFEVDGSSYPIVLKYTLESSGVKMIQQIYIEDKKGNISVKVVNQDYIFEGVKTIPVSIFEHNPFGMGEITYACMDGSVDFLDWLSNETVDETKYTKTMIKHNENFTDLSKEEVLKLYENNVRIVDEGSTNTKVQEGEQIFTSGSQVISFNQITINFIEDKIDKYIGGTRDAAATGANKQSLEIALQNQFENEALHSVKRMRQTAYERLFTAVCDVLAISVVKPELKVSLIEEAKVSMLEQQVEAAKNKGSMAKHRSEDGEQND